MDSITQAVLGATVQTAVLGRWQGRKALLYGAALATLPDLDVLIRYQDAVDVMTRHRGFSHSLPVLTLLALVLTLALRRWRPNPAYSGRRLFLALWLVLVTHPLLDAFTSYGTQLFWPFTPPPTAWSSVFIIDPLYTLPLLLAVLAGLVSSPQGKAPRGPLLALALSSLYLAFTVAGKWMAEQRVEAELARQGIQAEALFASPAPFNSLLWRVTVLDGERYHEALVSWFDQAPPALVSLPRGTALAEQLKASPQYARLAWFTDGVLRFDQVGDALVVTDLRLGFTGYHPFRFILARREGADWVLPAITERLPAGRGDLEQLELLWQRIWHQDREVPLAEWAAGLQRTP